MVKKIIVCFIFLLSLVGNQSFAASSDDIDKLTTYATILGRAAACGIDTSDAVARVGAWMDMRFPPGSDDQKIYLPIFIEGARHHAIQQSNGNSPDSCSTVQYQFNKVPWP